MKQCLIMGRSKCKLIGINWTIKSFRYIFLTDKTYNVQYWAHLYGNIYDIKDWKMYIKSIINTLHCCWVNVQLKYRRATMLLIKKGEKSILTHPVQTHTREHELQSNVKAWIRICVCNNMLCYYVFHRFGFRYLITGPRGLFFHYALLLLILYFSVRMNRKASCLTDPNWFCLSMSSTQMYTTPQYAFNELCFMLTAYAHFD